jgi:drug/metabolite transporter (DMT)-like permease
MSNSRENVGLFLGCLGVVMFAGTLPAARLAVSTVDPWFLTFGRAVVAGAIALAILVATRRRLPPRSVVTSLAIAALFVVFGFPLFSTFAMRTVPAAHGGVVLGILPLATAASAAVLAHERASLGFRLVGALGPPSSSGSRFFMAAQARSLSGICCCSRPLPRRRSATRCRAGCR